MTGPDLNTRFKRYITNRPDFIYSDDVGVLQNLRKADFASRGSELVIEIKSFDKHLARSLQID
jgi:hypothetical protein